MHLLQLGNDLERKYQTLIERRRRKRLSQNRVILIYVSATMIITYLLFVFAREFNYVIPMAVVSVSGASLLIGKILEKRSLKFNLTKQERMFFAFYDTYDKIEKYGSEANIKTKEELMETLEKLSRFVNKWKTDLTPLVLSEMINSLNKLLLSLIPFIDTKNNEKISSLKKALYEIAKSSSNSEPDMDSLNQFNQNLKSLFPMTVSATLVVKYHIKGKNKIKLWFKDHPKILYILIGICAVSGLIIIQAFPNVATTASTIYLGIFGIVGFVYQIYDRRKPLDSKHHKSSKSEVRSIEKSYDIEIPPFASKYIDNPYVKPREFTTIVNHKIIWQNNDEDDHSITSGRRRKISTNNDVEDGSPDGLFDKTLKPHEKFEFTFENEGIYHYYCKLHKCSEARIVVE